MNGVIRTLIQEVDSRAPSASKRLQPHQEKVIVSSMPKHIVDSVRAKFMQTPHATQFFEIQCMADVQWNSICDTKFRAIV